MTNLPFKKIVNETCTAYCTILKNNSFYIQCSSKCQKSPLNKLSSFKPDSAGF